MHAENKFTDDINHSRYIGVTEMGLYMMKKRYHGSCLKMLPCKGPLTTISIRQLVIIRLFFLRTWETHFRSSFWRVVYCIRSHNWQTSLSNGLYKTQTRSYFNTGVRNPFPSTTSYVFTMYFRQAPKQNIFFSRTIHCTKSLFISSCKGQVHHQQFRSIWRFWMFTLCIKSSLCVMLTTLLHRNMI
jgi:hypothetical protein